MWTSPGQNTGVGRHSFLQGIFPTQGLNPSLPHCRQVLYQLSYQGRILLQCGRLGFNPWVGKIPWRRERLPAPVFRPREVHGEFSRQEYWSGLPHPPPGDLPNPGIEPKYATMQRDSLSSELTGKFSEGGVKRGSEQHPKSSGLTQP